MCWVANIVQNKNYLLYLNEIWYEYSWQEIKEWDWQSARYKVRFYDSEAIIVYRGIPFLNSKCQVILYHLHVT